METPNYIWIVGASHGIGKALALELANRGHTVAVSARTKKDLDNLKSQLFGSGHLAVPLDVKDEKSIAKAQSQILKNWPHIDIVIFTAGIYQPMSFEDLDTKVAFETLDINTLGAIRLAEVVLPYFKKVGQGHFAALGSIAGYSGLPNSSAYGMSKAALTHMMECLKIDCGSSKLKIQLFSPGFVKTRLTDQNKFEMPDLITAEEAAVYIADGLNSKKFEIYFPRRFPLLLKFFRLFPYSLYFKIIGLLKS